MWRRKSQPFRNAYSCITKPTITAPITPTTLLRKPIENAIARHAKPKVGSRQIAQLTRTAPTDPLFVNIVPPSVSSGAVPTSTTPASNALSASVATATTVHVNAARTLPQKTAVRPTERVRTVLSVPWLSSDEKRSPATIAASSGRIHAAENASVVIGAAHPVVLRNRP